MSRFLLLLSVAFFAISSFVTDSIAQPKVLWQSCYGGMSSDAFTAAVATPLDGGFIAVGRSNSTDGNIGNLNHGGIDGFVVKLDASRQIQWRTTLGGSGDDVLNSISLASDGSFLISGMTTSVDFDVTDKKTHDSDAWIIKLSPAGTIIWSKTIGGSGQDEATVAFEANGGVFVAGNTNSTDGVFTRLPSHPLGHAWAAMLDDTGKIQWLKTYGGSGDDQFSSAVPTAGNGFALAGLTSSTDGDVSTHGAGGNHGSYDFWVAAIDKSGALLWQNCYGGSDYDAANAIIATKDGGYAVLGYTASNDSEVTGQRGNPGDETDDVWLVKLRADGSLDWEKTYGGSWDDGGSDILQTSDSGYVFTGFTNSDDGDVSGLHDDPPSGSWDAWVVRLGVQGAIQWQYSAGGTGFDVGSSIIQENDSIFMIAGSTSSSDGDVVGFHGDDPESPDCWMFEVGLTGQLGVASATRAPFGFKVFSSTQEQLLFRYELPSDGAVTIELFDLMGRNVLTPVEDVEAAGDQTRTANIRLTPGSYFARLTQGSQSITVPFQVAGE